MSPSPTDPMLYAKVKAEADRKYLTNSAYKSGWIVKTYKERGGKYKDAPHNKGGLTRWFKEKWVDLTRKNKDGTYAPCGRNKATLQGRYPLCRPSVHVDNHSPKTLAQIPREVIAKAKKEKQLIKQTGRITY